MSVRFTPGQKQYLDNLGTYGILQDTGRSWWASVRYGLRAYRSHRAAVLDLGDWLPWHDRPENQARQFDGKGKAV